MPTRHILAVCLLLALVLVGCAPADDTVLPTLAVLPTAITTGQTPTPTPTVAVRGTLPPTFTPTDTPTSIPPTATPTPTATLRVVPTSALGSPASAPENFPLNLTLRGGGFNLALAPPSAVRYGRIGDAYRLLAAYNGRDGQTVALALTMRADLEPGDYTLNPCASTDGTLAAGDTQCLNVVYTNTGLVAANPNGGTLTLRSLEPLDASVAATLAAARLPTRTDNRYNANAPVTLTLAVAGQARTD